MIRPAVIRSLINWFVPARRFWFASASCAAESLTVSAFLNVVSAAPTTSSMTVEDTRSSASVKPSSRDTLDTITLITSMNRPR